MDARKMYPALLLYFDTSKDVLEENKELSKDNARSKDHIIRRYDMMEG